MYKGSSRFERFEAGIVCGRERERVRGKARKKRKRKNEGKTKKRKEISEIRDQNLALRTAVVCYNII